MQYNKEYQRTLFLIRGAIYKLQIEVYSILWRIKNPKELRVFSNKIVDIYE